MIDAQPLAIQWRQRNKLPEDICLFKEGDSHPIFVSVTHEEEALVMTDKSSTFKGASISDYQSLDLLAHAGRYFCKE